MNSGVVEAVWSCAVGRYKMPKTKEDTTEIARLEAMLAKLETEAEHHKILLGEAVELCNALTEYNDVPNIADFGQRLTAWLGEVQDA